MGVVSLTTTCSIYILFIYFTLGNLTPTPDRIARLYVLLSSEDATDG